MRRDRRLPLAAEFADAATAQVELALGPGDPDEEQPPFFLQLVVALVGPRVRQQTLLEADDEDDRELEPLGRVQGHQGDRPDVVLPAVDRRGQADLLEEVDDRCRRDARGRIRGPRRSARRGSPAGPRPPSRLRPSSDSR